MQIDLLLLLFVASFSAGLNLFDKLYFDVVRVNWLFSCVEQSIQKLYITYQLAWKFKSSVNCFDVGQFDLSVCEVVV